MAVYRQTGKSSVQGEGCTAMGNEGRNERCGTQGGEAGYFWLLPHNGYRLGIGRCSTIREGVGYFAVWRGSQDDSSVSLYPLKTLQLMGRFGHLLFTDPNPATSILSPSDKSRFTADTLSTSSIHGSKPVLLPTYVQYPRRIESSEANNQTTSFTNSIPY